MEVLDLSDNKLQVLPNEIANLINLKLLFIYDNNFIIPNYLISNELNMIIIKKADINNNIIKLNILNGNDNNIYNNLPNTLEHLQIISLNQPLKNLPPYLKTLKILNTTLTQNDIKLPFNCELWINEIKN